MDEPGGLPPALAALVDRQAIVDVTITYCWALDTHRWDELDAVFAPDAVADLGGEYRGLDAIKGRVSDVLLALDASQHVVTTHQVRIDGDRATSRCYLRAQHVKADVDGGSTFMFAGTYEDDLVRTTDGWRIVRRRLAPIWSDGNPAVLVS
ncbi:MAG: nuclear transport factor 2 family protein [Ilumatobacteraceae bacterium]